MPRGRPAEYYPALEQIKDGDRDQWWVLAVFESLDGAKHAKSRINTGKTRIPDPADGCQWTFSAVRVGTRSELRVKHG